MAFLRNKKKVAAASRETPENTSQSHNTLDPENAQDYISQVSEEIEGRVTKKLSKEFSWKESRILGALSKLDEFLLNPQVRTWFVAVPGTTSNSDSRNRKSMGIVPQTIHFPSRESLPITLGTYTAERWKSILTW